jgi:uncharacterized protein with von Willebrand factor type A (vWA) domain
VKSRQVQGRKAEVRMARDRGARVHPMSGAGRIKDDASSTTDQFEFKNVLKTHTLNGKDLLALFRRAIRIGKNPVYVVYFEDSDITATIHITKGKR